MNKKSSGEVIIESFISALLVAGFVWFYAWAFNPDLTSGTIWFIVGLVVLSRGGSKD